MVVMPSPLRVLVAMLAAFLLLAPSANAFPPPDSGIASQCAGAGELLGDPVGADGYYRCLGAGKARYERCPGDQVFSVGAEACVSRDVFPPELGDWGVSVDAPRGTTVRLGGALKFRVTAHNLDGVGDLGSVRVRVTWPDGLSWGRSADCLRLQGQRAAYCYLGVEHGTSADITLTASPGLLTIGALTVRGEVYGSNPVDSKPANNRASATCHALTGIIVSC